MSVVDSAPKASRSWALFAILWMLTGIAIVILAVIPDPRTPERFTLYLLRSMFFVFIIFGAQGWLLHVWTRSDLGKRWAWANIGISVITYDVLYLFHLYKKPETLYTWGIITILVIIAWQTIILKTMVPKAGWWTVVVLVNLFVLNFLFSYLAGGRPPILVVSAVRDGGGVGHVLKAASLALLFCAIPRLLEGIVLSFLLRKKFGNSHPGTFIGHGT